MKPSELDIRVSFLYLCSSFTSALRLYLPTLNPTFYVASHSGLFSLPLQLGSPLLCSSIHILSSLTSILALPVVCPHTSSSFYLSMATARARRPRSAIESISSSNVLNAGGDWIAVEYKRFMWVTMQPSMRGAHKVPRHHMASRSHHWKGKILEFRQGKDGKRMAKVQHVYTAAQLKLDSCNTRRFPANCK